MKKFLFQNRNNKNFTQFKKNRSSVIDTVIPYRSFAKFIMRIFTP